MKKYKAPGAYAHFIPTENTVGTTGQIRVLALVGTGQQSFEKQNVLITRKSGSVSDVLPNQNILEIYSISSKPMTNKPDPTNKIYNNSQLKDNTIIWDSLVGPQYETNLTQKMVKGDASFLSNISSTIIDNNFIVDENYKIEISYVDRNDIGTYVVSKQSTGEVMGEYIASFEKRTDIIPGVSLRITSTFVLDALAPDQPKSKTKIGDYAIITTSAAKCHVDPTVNLVRNTGAINSDFTLVNNGSNYNIVGDGKGLASTAWPKLTNKITINKTYNTLKYQITFYKDGVLTSVENMFDKFSVGTDVGSIITGISKDVTVPIFDIDATSGPTSITSNSYDLTSVLGLSNSINTDIVNLSYTYVLKDDMSLDDANITIHLDIINTVGNVKLVTTDNNVFIRNVTISHSIVNQDEILFDLIKNVRIINNKNVVAGTYKIKINSMANNEITIFDVTNNQTIGTWSTDMNAEFKEAIPGISFDLYSFRDIEGITEMYGLKDILDPTGATVLITTLAGITNPEVPMDNSNYFVCYKYVKSEADYEPKIFTEYSDVIAEYGKYVVTASGKVINNLTLAAELAILNGALPIICVQAKNESDQEMNIAIKKLAKKVEFIDNINAIVPITTSKNVGNYLAKHVTELSMPEHNMYRIGYLAAEPNEQISKESTVASNSKGSIQMSQSYNNERIVYVVPGQATKSIIDPVTGYANVRALPGCYLAVAVAALSMKNDPAEPLTNKQILGFDNLLTFYGEPEANALAAAGCLVLRQEGNTIKVRHGITSHGSTETIADIQSNEITLVQIKDYVIDGSRKVLGELYVGGKLKPTIVNDINYTLTNLLNKYIAGNIIIGIEALTVKRDLEDPRQINVKFLIEAVYPLNYIDISFGFSTTIS